MPFGAQYLVSQNPLRKLVSQGGLYGKSWFCGSRSYGQSHGKAAARCRPQRDRL
jgi:hypothetical protein